MAVTFVGLYVLSTTIVPVVENDLGNSDTVFIDPELAVGYGFMLGGTNRFSTFQVPQPLAQGDDVFEILFEGISYELRAGEVFDFTSLDPLGVDSFLLVGIDESEMIDSGDNSHPPFVYGATFTTPGIAEVATFPLVTVPEPGGLFLLLVGIGCLPRRRQRRSHRSPDPSAPKRLMRACPGLRSNRSFDA